MYPVPTYSPYGDLIFFMDVDAVKKTISSAFSDEEMCLLLASADRKILYDEFSDEKYPVDRELLLEVSASQGALAGMELKGTQETLLYYTSETTGVTYAIIVPASLMTEGDMGYQKSLLMLICFLILVLCLTLAVAVSFFNYRPIRDLFHLMNKTGGKINELQALHEYIEDQKKIEDAVSWQEPYLQQRIMGLYLDGMLDETELERAFSDFCYPGQETLYCCGYQSLQ